MPEIGTLGFDVAGAGNVLMGAGLRPGAKAPDEPPDPTGGAPAPDPTDVAGAGNVLMGAGLRPGAKAPDEPPDPTGGAPAPDPTTLVLHSTPVSSMRGSGSAGWPTWLEPRRF